MFLQGSIWGYSLLPITIIMHPLVIHLPPWAGGWEHRSTASYPIISHDHFLLTPGRQTEAEKDVSRRVQGYFSSLVLLKVFLWFKGKGTQFSLVLTWHHLAQSLILWTNCGSLQNLWIVWWGSSLLLLLPLVIQPCQDACSDEKPGDTPMFT